MVVLGGRVKSMHVDFLFLPIAARTLDALGRRNRLRPASVNESEKMLNDRILGALPRPSEYRQLTDGEPRNALLPYQRAQRHQVPWRCARV